MRLNFCRYNYLWLLFACMFFVHVGAALSASKEPLPVAHGEIIRDVARLTFEWGKPVGFKLVAKGKKVSIIFERKANPDVGVILSKLYPYITHIELKPDGRTIVLALNKPYKTRKFVSNNISGVDLLGIAPPTKHAQSVNNATNVDAEEPNSELSTTEKIIMPLLPLESVQSAINENNSPNEVDDEIADNISENLVKLAPAAGEEKEVKSEENLDDGAANPDLETPATTITQQNKVVVSYGDDSATLRLLLKERSAFAVFIRNNHLWVVIEKPIKLDLSEFDDITKTIIRKPKIIPHSNATILYVPIDDNASASIKKEGDSNNLVVLITQKKQPVAFPLAVEVSTSPPVPPHVLILTLEMAEPITARDPVIGDSLIITPLFKIGEGINSPREFIEFDLLKTAQGIVAVKKADDVSVVQLRNGLRITTMSGAIISPRLPKLDVKALNHGLQANPTLFPFEMWKIDTNKSRKKILQELFHQIVETDNIQDANNARLRMAQIYLSEGFASEAIGLLDGINRADPSFYRSSKLNALRGVSNYLMTRYPESAKDFSATELNNSKEVEYWRSVLSDLLGSTGQSYDYLAMNTDYISKYPPIFRQRLAIVAADRAISSKDYNVALKIFDSLHQDNLLDSINAYINFLMAKISISTEQEKEATENLDKLAEDIKHPFVQARAEFTRIARDMDSGVDKDKIIDKLERLRLNWHGDGLELQILSLLGELYYEKKDYVNSMRTWNNGVESFKNTSIAIDMARKMKEVFILMFSEGLEEKLSPLEILALYYEYRKYMPSGTAGNEMLDRLAENLISVDLLEQAASLLDHQMRAQTEKEQRSQIGAKLAATYLLNHQPQKALTALKDSVYGKNPVMLRLLRNRLVAEATMDLDKPDLAIQTLGQDDSLDAENIRINIYWKTKDWEKLSISIENALKKRQDITAPITIDESEHLIKLALAYIFTDNEEQLQYLRDYFSPLMVDNPNNKVFDFVTSQDIAPNSRNFDEVIQSVNKTKTFIENYHARIDTM